MHTAIISFKAIPKDKDVLKALTFSGSVKENRMRIPRQLYSENILSLINTLISLHDAIDFYSLDEIHQDTLVSLGIIALENDVDVVLSDDAKTFLVRCLTSNDRDNEIELVDAVKESAREQFSAYFNEMIQNEVSNREVDSLHEAGKRSYIDKNSGETLWI